MEAFNCQFTYPKRIPISYTESPELVNYNFIIKANSKREIYDSFEAMRNASDLAIFFKLNNIFEVTDEVAATFEDYESHLRSIIDLAIG